MTNRNAEASPLFYARAAGLAYLLVILLGVFGVSYVDVNIIVPGDDAATVDNLMANEFRFRTSVVSEIMMYALVIVLSLALYIVLKTVNRNLALLALLFRFGEAIIGGGLTVLAGLIPLMLLNKHAVVETEQLHVLVGLFLGVRNAGLDIVLMFVGVGGTLFCYLFYQSRYIPRVLAAWGMFTYLSMLILAFISILLPKHPAMIEVVLYGLGALFEVIIGLWLLIKGVNVRQWDNRVPASP